MWDDIGNGLRSRKLRKRFVVELVLGNRMNWELLVENGQAREGALRLFELTRQFFGEELSVLKYCKSTLATKFFVFACSFAS